MCFFERSGAYGGLRLLRRSEYPLLRAVAGLLVISFMIVCWFPPDDNGELGHISTVTLLLATFAILRRVGVHLGLMIGYFCYRVLAHVFLLLRPVYDDIDELI